MILKIPENRAKIIEYLNEINEDTFANEFVIPFFNSQGYQTHRINSHGPEEHGKDIIFKRYIPIFSDNEYISVQVKSEKVDTKNVQQFSSQMIRALEIKFSNTSGGESLPHYAVFINSRTHTNDAFKEFPQLVKSQHIKILSQENVCELILQTGFAPKCLLNQLSSESLDNQTEDDKYIWDILLENDPKKVNNLLDHRLKFMRDKISQKTKEFVIDYIHIRWMNDRSWSGTAGPMEWFNTYFDFFSKNSENHSKYLLDVFKELLSPAPSYYALNNTIQIVNKTVPIFFAQKEYDFISFCAQCILNGRALYEERIQYLYAKIKEFKESNLIRDKKHERIAEIILSLKKYYSSEEHGSKENYDKIMNELRDFLSLSCGPTREY